VINQFYLLPNTEEWPTDFQMTRFAFPPTFPNAVLWHSSKREAIGLVIQFSLLDSKPSVFLLVQENLLTAPLVCGSH